MADLSNQIQDTIRFVATVFGAILLGCAAQVKRAQSMWDQNYLREKATLDTVSGVSAWPVLTVGLSTHGEGVSIRLHLHYIDTNSARQVALPALSWRLWGLMRRRPCFHFSAHLSFETQTLPPLYVSTVTSHVLPLFHSCLHINKPDSNKASREIL